MSDTIVLEPEQKTEPVKEFNPFSQQSWSDTPTDVVTEPVKQEENKEGTPGEPVKEPVKEDVKPFVFKKKYGWDSEEVAIQEIENLKNKTEKPFEFKNDDSRKAFEYLAQGEEDKLYEMLHNKKQIDRLVKSDLNDKKTAAELVKFGISNKNKDLTTDEVDFLFNERFSAPDKPIQHDETDEEFTIKIDSWKRQVENIEKRLVIEAKLAKPELEKLKSELVFPDIKGNSAKDAEAEQKELQRLGEIRQQYLQSLNSDYQKFNGYEVKYKDEEVEIPISFVESEEQKTALKKELETFDVEGFIMQRWFDKTGNPQVKTIMEDVTLLRKRDDILQKMVNEAGANVRKHYMKIKGNVSVTGTPTMPVNDNNGGQKALEEQVDYLWKAKY